MIKKYHRPKTLDEALRLLIQPDTVPLGGGTVLSKPTTGSVEVVEVNGRGYGALRDGDEVLVDHGEVSIHRTGGAP